MFVVSSCVNRTDASEVCSDHKTNSRSGGRTGRNVPL